MAVEKREIKLALVTGLAFAVATLFLMQASKKIEGKS